MAFMMYTGIATATTEGEVSCLSDLLELGVLAFTTRGRHREAGFVISIWGFP